VMEPSHVLMAMGRSKQEALAGLRISLHAGTSVSDLEKFVDSLERVVNRMRKK
jgi:cysteine desulfurase